MVTTADTPHGPGNDPAAIDPRDELVALWRALAARGAVVHWQDTVALPDTVIKALCGYEARRLRALLEGEAYGCTPGGRQGPAAPEPPAGPAAVASLTDSDTPMRSVVALASRQRPPRQQASA